MPNENLESLIEQNNDLIRKQLIIKLAELGVPHQNIRKIVKVDMKYITDTLRHLKGRLSK